MRTIEITTTQNVTIEHDLATIGDRIIAFIIDFLIIWAGIVLLAVLIDFSFSADIRQYMYYLVLIPTFLFYSLLFDVYNNGRSLGKKSMGIKVVKINGTEAGISDYVIRWIFRIVDIYFSLGSVGLILMSSTSKLQRLGDIVANTAVIKIKPRTILRLSDLTKIKSREDYEPQYPEVRQMSESDMMTVKTVLDQFSKYSNDAHQLAMDELVNNLRERLNIAEQVTDQRMFLRTLIKDYIVLTR